ncbi:alpha/beta hydrolase [Streptoalloteichus hindustanus]|uniref:TAP-like protein n=1 Tax=Streptoalloteichus hindustanus TaxID=2017 RepID=A0A1M5I7V2_STRHI|nr:alpha/beta hydrolase [Streptoalloteichus hindustanus]SHG24287.1 TAP-like protein [Streptoalloteichus hindustanus]
MVIKRAVLTGLSALLGLTLVNAPAAPAGEDRHPCARAVTRCDGEIQVPLNWSDPTSERITVPFTWIPHTRTGTPSAGTVAGLPGGPAPALAATPLLTTALGSLLETHDLLVVERRGFAAAGGWRCPELDLSTPDTITACAQREARRQPFFTTAQRVADIQAVRSRLGLRRLTLYGYSYGTLDAQAFAARYPRDTAAVLLDSPITTDTTGFTAGWAYPERLRDHLDKLSLVCEHSRSCRDLPGSARDRFAHLVLTLRARPDPRVPLAALNALAQRQDDPVPGRDGNAAIAAYLAGDPAPLHRLAAPLGPPPTEPQSQMIRSAPAYLSYLCADSALPYDRAAGTEEKTRQLADHRRRHPERPMGTREVFPAGDVLDWCTHWPTPNHTPPVPPGTRFPDVPTLAIAGDTDLDTGTRATAVARRFPRGQAVIVPFGQHTASLNNYPYSGCVAAMVRDFITDPRQRPSSSCGTENYRALGHFPRTSAELPATNPPGLAPAFATAADAVIRRAPQSGYRFVTEEPGLRGGAVRFDDQNRRVLLTDVRYVADIAVTGDIRLPDKDGTATATLTLSTGQRLHLSWKPFRAEDTTTVSGSVDDRPFTTRLPTT